MKSGCFLPRWFHLHESHCQKVEKILCCGWSMAQENLRQTDRQVIHDNHKKASWMLTFLHLLSITWVDDGKVFDVILAQADTRGPAYRWGPWPLLLVICAVVKQRTSGFLFSGNKTPFTGKTPTAKPEHVCCEAFLWMLKQPTEDQLPTESRQHIHLVVWIILLLYICVPSIFR